MPKIINNNLNVRTAIKMTGMQQWKVAIKLGITEVALSRKLRHELPEEEQKELVKRILMLN